MPPRQRVITDKKIDMKSLKRLLIYVFRNYKFHLLIVAVCLIISSVTNVIAATFLQRLIDEVITPGISSGIEAVAGDLLKLITTMASLYVIGILATTLYNQLMAGVGQGTIKKLRDAMFDNMETLPIRYFDTHSHGEIMSTYTNDVDTIRQLVGQSIPNMFQSFLSLSVVFITMISYSIWLTIVVMLAIFAMFRITGKFGGRSARYMVAQQKSLAEEEGFIEEMMEGMKVVKVFTHEEEAKKDFDKLNEKLFEDARNANRNANALMPILGNMGNILYVILSIVGSLMVSLSVPNLSLRGIAPLSIGIIISFLSLARTMSMTVTQVSMQVSMVAQALAGSDRVFALIDEKSEEDDGYVTLVRCTIDDQGNIYEADHYTGKWAWKHYHAQSDHTTTYKELKGDIEMVDVDFAYNPDKQILFDISLYAKPGQKIAFVGATGAGKTTITNLINRFYDIPDGKIRYDGININKIKKPDLRRSLGMVLQDVNLFTGTVMDNIRYGNLYASDEECIEAAKLANADDFIRRLPEGYDTMLTGNGSQLSQGQRQLISIARAAVANPPVMILDEATSSIDTRTEALVQKGMDNLMKGRTVFVIAHRLSTVRDADAIMVLDHGRIIERGTHDQLLAMKGTYYQLYTGAFELE
ncbi:MAG: ABC transporter ATP-binding protein/permease [Erysipelotrichaceae bacterium]|nr:ABC transporter ATP-binding protein/permease [Erysipelotrichaceae bacterium]